MESVHDTRILYSSTLYHLKGLSHTLALPCACSTPHSSPIGLEGGGRSMRGVSKVLAVFSSGMMQRLEEIRSRAKFLTHAHVVGCVCAGNS